MVLSFRHDASSALFSNDDMVQHSDAYQFTYLCQSIGYCFVFAAWGWVPGWMIVDEQNCRSGVANRGTKHFPWMNEACVQGADRDEVRVNWTMLRVQGDNVKLLLLSIDCQPAEGSMQYRIASSEPRILSGGNDCWSLSRAILRPSSIPAIT